MNTTEIPSLITETSTTTRIEESNFASDLYGASIGVVIFSVIVAVAIAIFLIIWFILPRTFSSNPISSLIGQDATAINNLVPFDMLPENQSIGSNFRDIKRFIQFSFSTTEQSLSCILGEIANQRINLEGYWISKPNNSNFTNVRLISGNNGNQQSSQNSMISRILDNYRINFSQRQVLGVAIENIPGQYDRIQSMLFCRVVIRAVYTLYGTNRTIYDVNNINAAQYILENASRIRSCYKTCLRR